MTGSESGALKAGHLKDPRKKRGVEKGVTNQLNMTLRIPGQLLELNMGPISI